MRPLLISVLVNLFDLISYSNDLLTTRSFPGRRRIFQVSTTKNSNEEEDVRTMYNSSLYLVWRCSSRK
ncbi:hypothetical protein L2E82_13287 [Cichorium intybus]|uniref:Uncharacterized protein n=1 Tax=Cichorium intybus TaxID=13427 RepID=A0ACB9GKF1_CICIN|nr:hypothetical protein L2E82_13287 [Cichorium intybus]